MSTLNQPSWPHSSVELLIKINKELANRLNSDPQQRNLWTIDPMQLELSRTGGGYRIIWSIIGGSIERGWQAHGPNQPAKCVASRKCRLQAEIRTNQARTVGFTPDDLLLAEEALRQIIIVWDKQRSSDFDIEEQEEQWSGFTEEVGQRQILCQYRVTPQLMVQADPYLFKTIDSIDNHGEITT